MQQEMIREIEGTSPKVSGLCGNLLFLVVASRV